ncbi:UPF0606 protein KIAA1549L-like [Rhinoraja longicauda]
MPLPMPLPLCPLWVAMPRLQVTPRSPGMGAGCVWLCSLVLVMMLLPVSSRNGPGMIYQVLDLSTPLPPVAPRPFRASHFSEVWFWALPTTREPTLSSRPPSSTKVDTLVSEFVEEVTIRTSTRSPLTETTAGTAMTTIGTNPSSTHLPTHFPETEAYETWHIPKQLMPDPTEGTEVFTNPVETPSATLPKSSDPTVVTPSPPGFHLGAVTEPGTARKLTPPSLSPSTTVFNRTAAWKLAGKPTGATATALPTRRWASITTTMLRQAQAMAPSTAAISSLHQARRLALNTATISSSPRQAGIMAPNTAAISSSSSPRQAWIMAPSSAAISSLHQARAMAPSTAAISSSSSSPRQAWIMAPSTAASSPHQARTSMAPSTAFSSSSSSPLQARTMALSSTTAAISSSSSPHQTRTMAPSTAASSPHQARTSMAPSTAFSSSSSPHQARTMAPTTTTAPTPAPTMRRTSTPPALALTAALTSLTTAAMSTRGQRATAQVTAPAAGSSTSSTPAATSSPTPGLNCRLSDQLWVRTVVTLSSRRIQTDAIFQQNLTWGLTKALQRAFFNNGIRAEIESLDKRNKVFVGFYTVSGSEVYIPATVTEVIADYGIENLRRDLQSYVPGVQSVLIAASPWAPIPAPWFQLRTVLQFVSTTDIIKFCSFVQTMEARLQRAFEEAESRATTAKSNLRVQILNTSVLDRSTAVTMVYMVRNRSMLLNGTTASSLLHHLTPAELGYYLAYPPLTLAEPLEYDNLDTSPATEKYWVVTVIQGVDNTSLGERYQRFASLMEQRLSNLFVAAQQHGRRFRRASTIGAYTVQLVRINRLSGPKSPAELTYYALEDGKALLGTMAAKILNTVDSQSMALELGYRVQLQAEPVVKNPPNNLWIIAAVLAPVSVVTVIIIIISTVLCRKNKSELKSETLSNLHQRAKPVQGFDYAKQHIGQYGGEDEVAVTQETVILPVAGRDATAPQEREAVPEADNNKAAKNIDNRRSRLQSERDSILSEQSANLDSTTDSAEIDTGQQRTAKEGLKRQNVPASDEEECTTLFEHVSKSSDDPFDTPSGSVQLLSIKPLTTHTGYTQSGSDKSPEIPAVNGEVSKALKQKSDIEHYRNKLRLKAKRKGYYDFPEFENNRASLEQQRKVYEKEPMDVRRTLEAEVRASSTFSEARNRQSQMKNTMYRSRQSLNSPSPGGTEMDMLVTREKSRRGIRNNGYDIVKCHWQLPDKSLIKTTTQVAQLIPFPKIKLQQTQVFLDDSFITVL